VGGRCDPSLPRAILSALEVSSHEKALYKCLVFNFFFFFLTLYSVVQVVRTAATKSCRTGTRCWRATGPKCVAGTFCWSRDTVLHEFTVLHDSMSPPEAFSCATKQAARFTDISKRILANTSSSMFRIFEFRCSCYSFSLGSSGVISY